MQWDGNDSSRSGTPSLQNMANKNIKMIKMDRAEIEQQPGGKTIHVPMQDFKEEKKHQGVGA